MGSAINPRLSRDAFLARWLSHRRIGTKPEMVAEFVGATYGHVRIKEPSHEYLSDEYDGLGLFALSGVHSIPTIARILPSDHIQADERRVFNGTSDTFSLFCKEEEIIVGAETKAVAVQFLRRPDGVSPGEFMAGWERQDDVLAGVLGPALVRYVRNVVCAPQPTGFGYDGVAELWFESAEAMEDAAQRLNDLLRDSTFVDPANSMCILTDVVMSRPRT